jgi:ubiquinol oxidase
VRPRAAVGYARPSALTLLLSDLKIHFAESWNELHHLRIAEELGGADRFADRFLAQHLAVAYYWVTVSLYLLSPRMAYNLMEQIEEHAFHTYDSFVQRCGAELATLPVPAVAREYYETNEANQWLFDEFQASGELGSRRPKLDSLRDVFEAIRDDEGEHAATMRLCQSSGKLRSPHDTTGAALDPTCEGVIECAAVAPTGWRAEEEAARKAALPCVQHAGE